MSFSLELDDAQQAIHDALLGFCDAHAADAAGRIVWSRELWSELAELGVLAPCTAAGEGGALEIAAAMEALGGRACPGPFVATYFSTQALAGDPGMVERLCDGRSLVALGEGGVFPFGTVADVWIAIEGETAVRGTPAAKPEPAEQLGGDPVARLELRDVTVLGPQPRARALADVARAAQLAGGSRSLVALASEHARTRKQFRKPIGDFQAVAHPLAQAHMRSEAAGSLARLAAFQLDAGDPDAQRTAAQARLSAATAAEETVHVVHQVFGAVGITLEGPIYHRTRRLRQWIADAPSAVVARETVLRALGSPWRPRSDEQEG